MPKIPVKEGKLLCSYNVGTLGDLYEEKIAEYKEQGYDEDTSKIYAQGDFDDSCREMWDEFLYNFGEYLYTKGIKRSKELAYVIKGENIDYNNSKVIMLVCLAENGEVSNETLAQDVVNRIAPKNTEYSIEVYNYGNDVLVKVFHHDVPLGAKYYLEPLAYSTYKRFS